MKKLLGILFLFTLIFGLISCKPDETVIVDPEDITVEIQEETVVGEMITVHVVIGVEIETLDEILEITLSIASQTYEKHFDMINGESYTLSVYLYLNEADYTANNNSYGYHTFNINTSLENPGLSLGTNALKLA